MATPLSAEHIAIIKACVPVLQAHGVSITKRMYEIMFSENPEVKLLFNQTHQKRGLQPVTLANAVLAYAENIENLGALGDDVERIAHKHCSLNILPEHYPIVGGCLLRAIKDVLGDAATEAVIGAWAAGYGLLADVLIGREHQLYEEAKARPGGWAGFREFEVSKKEVESDVVTSFYLVPSNKGLLPTYLPGQYIAIKATVPNEGPLVRNYSLSSEPTGTYLRISVKREDGSGEATPQGIMSSHLHSNVNVGDTLLVTPPFGDFSLKSPAGGRPVVLLSAGVGITPLASMLGHLIQTAPKDTPVIFVHGARSGSTHALKSLFKLAEKTPNFTVRAAYSRPADTDAIGTDYHRAGHVDMEYVKEIVPSANCDFYVCGPSAFVGDMVFGLQEWGVAAKDIHFECFGPFAAPKPATKLQCPMAAVAKA